MGSGFVQYSLPDSGRDAWVFWSAHLDYRLADGTTLPVLYQPAWCDACGRFALAEHLPAVEDLEREIERLRSGDPEMLQVWAFISDGEPVTARVAELHRYVAWRQGRKGPPRCLECGTPGPVPVPMGGEFAHPRTAERVAVRGSGWADAEPWVAAFSPEGEHIG